VNRSNLIYKQFIVCKTAHRFRLKQGFKVTAQCRR